MVEADARVEADHPNDTFGTRPTIPEKPHYSLVCVVSLGALGLLLLSCQSTQALPESSCSTW